MNERLANNSVWSSCLLAAEEGGCWKSDSSSASDVEVCLYVAGLGLIAGELSPFPPAVPHHSGHYTHLSVPQNHAARPE